MLWQARLRTVPGGSTQPCLRRIAVSCAYSQRLSAPGPSSNRDRPDRGAPGQAQPRRNRGPPTKTEPQRLAKVLAGAGVASRRACEELIAQGKVKVNKQVITEQGIKVDAAKDVIEVNGKRIAVGDAKPLLYYFALNKPSGYVCSNVSSKPGKRAVDLLEPWLKDWKKRNEEEGNKDLLPPRLFTVGRIDVATTGLVLLTNDGQWANDLIHPSRNLTKEYIATLDAKPTIAQLNALAKGTVVEGALVVPKGVELMTPLGPEDRSRVRIVVSEGKKHEVRHLVADAGMSLRQLKRVRIGGYRMPASLRPGAYLQLQPRLAAAALIEDTE